MVAILIACAVLVLGALAANSLNCKLGEQNELVQALNRMVSDLGRRVPKDPRLCSTYGHELEAVYDESAGTELSEDKISALSDADRMNSESIVDLIELATKNKSRLYVKHVCKYCGLVVKRDGAAPTDSLED